MMVDPPVRHTAPTTPAPGATITDISGGEQLAVDYAALSDLAAQFAHASTNLAQWAVSTGLHADSVDLLTSAPLAPVTFAEAEAAITAAAAMLGAAAPTWLAAAATVRVAAERYEFADRGATMLLQEIETVIGMAAGNALRNNPGLIIPVGIISMGLWAASSTLSASERAALGEDLQTLLAEHPGLANGLVNVGGGVLAGMLGTSLLSGGRGGLGAISGLTGPESGVRTTPLGSAQVSGGATQPRNLTGLISRLSAVNDAPDGTIAVQQVTGADGQRRWIVYLPGTDDMDPTDVLHKPGNTSLLRDMTENERLTAGQPTAYAAGVKQALQQAGASSTDPVMLVGHSQGGMVAEEMASERSGYDITQVVTAGSPAVPGHIPDSVSTLQLEHDNDVVPSLDGSPNVPGRHHVTVTFDADDGTLAQNHSLPEYEMGAQAVDASTDPNLVDAVGSMDGFLGSGTAETQLFELQRQ